MARGGSNSKKYDLIDWKTVRSMKDKGRLEMKGSKIMNVSMVDKLLWRIITRNLSLWKNILWKK